MSDLIDRQAAIDALRAMQTYKLFAGDDMLLIDQAGAQTELMLLPPAQPSAGDCWGCNCPKMERLAQPEPSQVAKDIARIVENEQDMRVIAQPEIIRCRNCKFASGDSRICMKFGHSPIGELDFCAWAERRTDE